MCAVHLGVMELERYRQCPFPQMPFVLAPYQKRIIEHSAVHADGSVYVILCEGGCSDNHTLGQVVIPAAFGNLLCQPQVICIELMQIIGVRDIAGADFTLPVGDNSVDGNRVVLHQSLADGKHIEFLDAACCPSDAPAHQHVELQPCPLADPDKTRDIHYLEKGEHWHGSIHPHLECVGAGCFFGIYFFHSR